MGPREAVMTTRIDPLLCDLDLSLRGTFYPAGFPLRLATNSRDVMEAASDSWGAWRREFDSEPLEFRVLVQAAGELAAVPAFRKQGRLLSFVSDRHNYAVADCGTLAASLHLSERTAADHAWMRWFFLEAMAYMLLTQRYVVSLHTACVARNGAGILLCGPSGAGKSTLSFACARAGFTYLADDCTWMLAGSEDRIAIGKPHQVRFRHDAARHFPELEGHIARTRPNGDLSIEVPTSLFPEIATAARSPIRCLVFLDRGNGDAPRIERMNSDEAVTLLLADMPSYGPEVNAVHEKTIHSLVGLPAWRLTYRVLEDAIRLLSETPIAPE
jgi:hypothetical protein